MKIVNSEDNNLNNEVKKLHFDYEELRAEIEGLLLQDKRKVKPRIIGAFTSAGATIEKLLLYIIKKEGREDQVIVGKAFGISEFKRIVQDKIPKQQNIHIGTIIQWRNLVAHANDIDKVDEHELRSVNTALKSFVEWFFEGYLNGQYADFSINEYETKKKKAQELNNVLEHEKENSNPKIQNHNESLRGSWSGKKPLRIFLFLVLFTTILYFIMNKFYADYSSNTSVNLTNKSNVLSTPEDIYNFLEKYYTSLSQKKSDAHEFFADKVLKYYTLNNMNPTQINVYRQTEVDYIDFKHTLKKESITLHRKNDSICYWRFWNDFGCYRTTKKKFQTCEVLEEFGINKDGKIVSIEEIVVRKLKFWKKKPY